MMSPKQSTIAVVDLGLAPHDRSRAEKSAFRRIGSHTLLERTIRRLSDSLLLDSIAVTGAPDYTERVQQSHLQPSRWFPTVDQSPLARVANVAQRLETELVVLVSPSCPFIDPVLVDKLVSSAWGTPDADFVAFYSPSRPTFSLEGLGLVGELIHYRVLKKLCKDPRFSSDPRRIPKLVRSLPETFQARLIPLPSALDLENLRFTVETEDDWDRAHQIIEASGDDYDYRDLVKLASNINCGRVLHG